MGSWWEHYRNGFRRLWIRHYGPARAVQEHIAERTRGQDYYKLFDEIYSKAHQAGAQKLFDAGIYRVLERVIDRFLAQYAFRPHATECIDFGCGEGINALYLARRGFRVTGVDVSPTAIARAREIAAQAGAAIQYHVGDVLDLAMCPAGRFDFGINIGCLHMLVTDEHRRRHIREMGRVLKPGGLLLLFNELSLRDVLIKDPERYLASFTAVEETKQVEVGGGKAEIRFKGVGFRKASAAQYRAEIEQAGFEVLTAEAVGRLPAWQQWLRLDRPSRPLFLELHARKRA